MYWMKFEDFLRLSGLSLNPESPHMMSGREEQIEDRWAAVISSILGQWEKCPAGGLQSNLPGFKPAVSQDNDIMVGCSCGV